MRRYTADELLGMKSERLQKVATEAGLPKRFHKNLNARMRVTRILKWYAEQDVEAKATAGPPSPDDRNPVNPDLERLCESGQIVSPELPQNEAMKPVENRGGPRPGAGRPPGMTAERARLTHVTDIPHRLYVSAFSVLFEIWSEAVGCEQVALTKEEAETIALPWSQMGEYVGWNYYIPEWIDIVICGLWTTANMFKIKARIARQFRDDLKARGVKRVKVDDSVGTVTKEVPLGV